MERVLNRIYVYLYSVYSIGSRVSALGGCQQVGIVADQWRTLNEHVARRCKWKSLGNRGPPTFGTTKLYGSRRGDNRYIYSIRSRVHFHPLAIYGPHTSVRIFIYVCMQSTLRRRCTTERQFDLPQNLKAILTLWRLPFVKYTCCFCVCVCFALCQKTISMSLVS